MTERFPEIADAAHELAERNGARRRGAAVASTAAYCRSPRLQRRIGRKNLSPKILSEVPVILQCYDLLEYEGKRYSQLRFSNAARVA